MAIKKYHVSQNLWSFSDISIAVGERFKTTTIVLPSGTYTFKAKYSSDNTDAVTIGFYDENNQIHTYNMAQNNGYVQYSYTGTITAIRLYTANGYNISASYAADFTDIMLNTGSTPLPYEPYGNTWNTIPYRKYGTETDTITTLPKTIIGDGQSASAVIKGNLTQSGTPTPANPIYPQETGDKTANLVESQILNANIAANGQIINFSPQNTYNMCIAKVEEGETYCFYNRTGPYGLYANYPAFNSSAIDGTRHFESTITIPNGANYIAVRADYDVNIMVVKGTTPPTSYEPYGVKIPISCGGTTTPVYLGEVQSIRKIKKLVFNGTENWQKATNFLYLSGLSQSSVADCLCTHYKGTTSGTNYTCTMVGNIIRVYDSSYSTAEDFKTYLAQQYANGTPVTVWYVLSTPTTGIVNEPIRKIGTYSDSVTGTGIPTTGTAETFDVDTTLKPSEVSLTYHGWHEHSDTVFTTE